MRPALLLTISLALVAVAVAVLIGAALHTTHHRAPAATPALDVVGRVVEYSLLFGFVALVAVSAWTCLVPSRGVTTAAARAGDVDRSLTAVAGAVLRSPAAPSTSSPCR